MKTLFITDTHIGARSGSTTFRQLFREYYRDVLFPMILEQNITNVVHLGDFFDNRSAISVADINYINNEFIPLVESSNINWYIVVGNHDIHFKNTNEINSLSMFNRCKNVTIVEDKLTCLDIGTKKLVICPWMNVENYDSLVDDLKFYSNDEYILGGHFEIVGALMYKNSIPCDHGIDKDLFKNFHKVLSGHFHHPSNYGNIEYIGALFHYNWEDANDWRGYTIYDSETGVFTKHENPYCLFSAIKYEDVLSLNDADLRVLCEQRYVRLYVDNEYDKLEFKELKHKIDKCNPLEFDVVDSTVFDLKVAVEETKVEQSSTIKEPIEYAKAFSGDSKILSKFQEIYLAALSNRKDIQ